jgi:hypothetical protein
MSLSNPLPTTWRVVAVTKDAFEITRRVIERSPSHPQPECQQALQKEHLKLRERTLYTEEKALSLLQRRDGKPSQELEEIEGLLVLSLWATFESFLRDYFREKCAVLKPQNQPAAFANLLWYKHLCDDVEQWKMGELLDFLKDSLSHVPNLPKLIGDAKHILIYRNWVAHASPKRQNERRDLRATYNILNELIELLLQY